MPTIRERIVILAHEAGHTIEKGLEPIITAGRLGARTLTKYNEQKTVTNLALGSLDLLSRAAAKTTTAGALILGLQQIGNGVKRAQSLVQIYVRTGEWLTASDRERMLESPLKIITSVSLTVSAVADHLVVLFDLASFAAKHVGNTFIFGGVLHTQILGHGLRSVLVYVKNYTALLGFGISIIDATFIGKVTKERRRSSILGFIQFRFIDGDHQAWSKLNMNKTMFDLAANVAKCAIVILAGPELSLAIAVICLTANVVVYARCLHSLYLKDKEERIEEKYLRAINQLKQRGNGDPLVAALLPVIYVKVEGKSLTKDACAQRLLLALNNNDPAVVNANLNALTIYLANVA